MKQILFVDMDNVLVDFQTGIDRLSSSMIEAYYENYDECPGIFSLMDPMPGAIEAYKQLAKKYDTYILSTAPWKNPSAWKDKVEWVHKYLNDAAYKRLILSHNKHLCVGDYLIDDRVANGTDKFQGEHIHFGQAKFPDWKAVLDYLLNNE